MADILLLLKFIILLNENHFQQIQVVIKLLFSYLVLSRKGDTQGRGRDTEIIRKTERTSGRQKKKQAVFGVKLLLCIYYVPGSIFGATLRDPAAHTFLRGKPILQGRHHEHQHHLQQHTGPRALMEVGQPKKTQKVCCTSEMPKTKQSANTCYSQVLLAGCTPFPPALPREGGSLWHGLHLQLPVLLSVNWC